MISFGILWDVLANNYVIVRSDQVRECFRWDLSRGKYVDMNIYTEPCVGRYITVNDHLCFRVLKTIATILHACQ